jgi:hypothetical protein
MTVPLSTLPTGAKFRSPWEGGYVYIRLEPTAWDIHRDDPSHWLNGISPQVERRTDVVYVMDCERTPGVLMLMKPDDLVEPLPPIAPVSEYAYRVTVETEGLRETSGWSTLEGVRGLIRAVGLTQSAVRVAIEHNGVHIGADGVPCKEQGKGLQFRNVECRVNVGSVVLA